MSQGGVLHIRPAELEFGGEFRPSVSESASNIFVQEIKAQTYDERRMSWNFRSPSQNLLCSPHMTATFRCKVRCPYRLSKSDQVGPLLGAYDSTAAGALYADSSLGTAPIALVDHGDEKAPDAIDGLRNGYKYRPMLAFSEGNAFMNACENVQISINGVSWSQLNQNLYNKSLDQCFVPPREQQKSWSTCGGKQNEQDSVPISGHVLGLPDSLGFPGLPSAAARFVTYGTNPAGGGDAARDTLQTIKFRTAHQNMVPLVLNNTNTLAIEKAGFRPTEGATMDSGLTARMGNFIDSIVAVRQARDAANNLIDLLEYDLEITAPIQGGVFNDLYAASGLSRQDPRLRQPLGIPHVNQCQVTLQFKDLIKRMFRRLGRGGVIAAANAATGAAASADDIDIQFDSSYQPRLRATYIRLASFRSFPEQVQLQTYRREIRRADGGDQKGYGDKVFQGGLFGKSLASTVNGLACGGDLASFPTSQYIKPIPAGSDNLNDTKEITWGIPRG